MDYLFSDFDSFSESSSSDDQEDIDSLYGGHARTIFSRLEDSIEKIDDFLMFERGFLHGDIVRLVSDPLGQLGKVFNMNMIVDLENVYGLKTHNVSSGDLRRVRSVSTGDYVVRGSWLGKAEKVVDCLTVVFDDGSRCQLTADGPKNIIPVSPDLIEDPQLPFYPGQRVRIESSVSRPTQWCGFRRDKHNYGTVCEVDTGPVYVNWIVSCAGLKGGPSPARLQNSKNLHVLSGFLQASWQLGDWCAVKADVGVLNSSSPQIGVIVKTKMKVDVQWQDGSHSLASDSHLLFPVNIIDAHEFWSDAFVSEKGTNDESKDFQNWGVVTSVDPKERMVKVRWLNGNEKEEVTVSAYELLEHSDYTFAPGEAVFRTYENSENRIGNIDDQFLSYFGTVVGLKNGYVEVKWGTGAIGKVAPYEVFRVDKYEDSTVWRLDHENVQPPNEELPVNDRFLGQKLKDVFGLNRDNAHDSGSISISQVAMGLFNSITTRLFGSMSTSPMCGYKCTSEGVQTDGKVPAENEALELCNMNRDSEFHVLEDLEMHEKLTSPQIKEANEDDVMVMSVSKIADSFRPFEMVNDCSDHHFVNGMGMQSPQVKGGWLKKVHQEWSILEKDLSETIYVRVYEERMDLLRAAIVGTAGTPYHDGLFFFDIYLPPLYPNEPPMVYYNSSGLRINPNLYESGKVCLSLLNTWNGSRSEVWNPNSSTILQVLLSLQALVLNEKPYFNEAGYDSQIGKVEGEKNSVSYNENAFLVSCRSMLYLLRKPPKHFEELVDEHFSRRCKNILNACKSYMQGAPIGHPFDCEITEKEIHKGSSTGFKIMLAKLCTKLAQVFTERGFDCSDFSDQVP